MIYLLFITALAITPQQIFEIKCESICQYRGFDKGIVVGKACGCWKIEDLDTTPLTIKRIYSPETKVLSGFYE